MTATPADHSFYFDLKNDPCPYCDTEMAGEINCQNCGRERPCDHIPKKAALDDEFGCIRCGQWLGKAQ